MESSGGDRNRKAEKCVDVDAGTEVREDQGRLSWGRGGEAGRTGGVGLLREEGEVRQQGTPVWPPVE